MKKLLFLSLSLFVATASLFAQGSSGTNPSLIMYRYNSSSTLSPLPVLNDDLIGTLRWNGLVTYGNIRTGAAIQSYVTNVAAPNLRANMIFQTSGPAGLVNRMIITDEGRVGIATNTPSLNVLHIPNADFRLHVEGNTYTSGDFYGRIHFDDNQTTPYLPGDYIDEAYFELKQRATLTGANSLPASANSRGGVLSLAPGGNSLDHQLFFGDDGVWNRIQSGANTWGNWYRFLTTENINGNVGRVARFTGATLGAPSSSLGNSQLFDDGIRVGIRNLTPDASTSVDILGATRIDGNLGLGILPSTFRLDVNGNSRQVGNAQVVGRVAISPTTNPPMFATDYALSVEGRIITDEVRVALKTTWSDYVFEKDYDLKPLDEVEKYVQENKHLPGVASAKEVAENGLNLGEMQKVQMEKIEELYLHVIQQQKLIEQQQKTIERLESEINNLKK